jgi:hypothetical protein
MNAPALKRRRSTQPTMENLEMRIAPTAVTAAVALAAELKVEGRQVTRWETALTTTALGSHHQQVLLNHIARTEHRMGVQDVRLARLEASPMYRIKGQPTPHPKPSPIIQPYAVTAATGEPMYRIKGQPTPHPSPSPIIQPYAATAATGAVSSPVTTTNPVSVGAGTTSGTQSGGSTATGSQSSLPANASPVLSVIYDAYTQDPTNFLANLPSTDLANKVVIQGSNVGIQVHDNNPADFATLVSQLQAAGMQILSSSATYGLVVGMLPIAQLPAVAGLPEVPSVTAMFQPLAR